MEIESVRNWLGKESKVGTVRDEIMIVKVLSGGEGLEKVLRIERKKKKRNLKGIMGND